MPKAPRTLILATLFLATGLVAPRAAIPSEALGHQSPMLPGGVVGCGPGGFSAVHFTNCDATESVRQPDGATSADGKTLYVTGESWDNDTDHHDFATLAYATDTGDVRWLARYAAPLGKHEIARALALSPDGSRLFVGGVRNMNGVGKEGDYLAVAYDTETGAQVWTAVYDGAPDDSAWGIAVSPDGKWVYMTGKSGVEFQDVDYATVAFRALDGSLAWAARYGSAGGIYRDDAGISLVTSADGSILYMTGTSGTDFVTIAYLPATAPTPGK